MTHDHHDDPQIIRPDSPNELGPLALPLDRAIHLWLTAKFQRSHSDKTALAYREILLGFRQALQGVDLDLNSDPRLVALAAEGWANTRSPEAHRDGPVAAATYSQRLAILSSFYAYCQRHGLLESENPIQRVERRPVQAYAHATALTPTQVQGALRQIDRTTLAGMRDYALLGVGLNTGRRLSELASLQWRHVQVLDARVILTFARAKGNKVRRDALPQAVGRALLTWLHAYYGATIGSLAPDTPIWVNLSTNNYGTPLTIWGIGDICQRRIGTRQVHTLRHTFAHQMEDRGAKVSEIQARLGHESLATTGRYLAKLRSEENPYGEDLAAALGFE